MNLETHDSADLLSPWNFATSVLDVLQQSLGSRTEPWHIPHLSHIAFDTPHAPTLVSVAPVQCLANANGPLLQLFCCETHFAIFAWRMLIRVKCSTQINSGPE